MPDFRLHFSNFIAGLCYRLGCVNHYLRALDKVAAKRNQQVSVLFLCRGNICRSPYAARSFSKLCEKNNRRDIEVLSAGLETKPGKAADPGALAAAARRGVDLSEHRTVPASSELLDRADLIVIMDERQRALLRQRKPKIMENTLFLGALLLGQGYPLTIEDPYGQGADIYDRCFDKIDGALEILLGRING
jgi:protein-tyrosine phosphatase